MDIYTETNFIKTKDNPVQKLQQAYNTSVIKHNYRINWCTSRHLRIIGLDFEVHEIKLYVESPKYVDFISWTLIFLSIEQFYSKRGP